MGSITDISALGPRYKWLVLVVTTSGSLMAMIDSSITLIALPDTFRGIGLNPLEPGNSFYLLWMILGFMVVTAVLVTSLGRIGDIFGRVRIYNLGFAIFTFFSVLLSITWMHGEAAGLWLVILRIFQGVGAAMIVANSGAIITDTFPAGQRGFAMGINTAAAISGSFIGLVLGGVLAPIQWRLIYLIGVPIGLFCTIFGYLRMRELGSRRPARIDWWGNLTFAAGLVLVMIGITYGIEPYKEHAMGWTSPWVLFCLIAGVALLIVFGYIETHIEQPMFRLQLFKIRAFSAGVLASFLASLARGGLQFILIIWLQGIWLPMHGYSFERTPLWAGIAMLPLTFGMLISGPVTGLLSDRFGARYFSTGGMIGTAITFLLIELMPIDFSYWVFGLLMFFSGLTMAMFGTPNRTAVMNSLPAEHRGAGSGMQSTFQNSASVLSIGVFFTLILIGFSHSLPDALYTGLTTHGVSPVDAERVANLPPVSTLFSAFLGYNPIQEMVGNPVLSQLPSADHAALVGRQFFPTLISSSFQHGLRTAMNYGIVMSLIAAAASWSRGKHVSAAHTVEEVRAEFADAIAEA
ncbi:MAG TPA: MFS transporter [Jatrophihabitans sp.]